MGAATARMFVREGAKVVVADMLEHEGRQVTDAIGASARFEPLDVTKEESWAAVASPTSSRTPAHGSGATWIATPSPQWTFTTYSLPVSRRTHSRCGLHTRAVTNS